MDSAGTTLGVSRAPDMLCGRYRLTRRIGRGGSADVYAAVDEFLHRPVAVKLFRTDVPAGGGLRRVRAEMRMVARLRHPGLVTIFDAGVSGEGAADTTWVHPSGRDEFAGDESSATPYLVMELIEGATLRQRLARGALTAAETAQLGRSVADTLSYVHASGVVHRDVKPANILLDQHATDPRYGAKLTDFGIARLTDSTHMTADGTTLGTANYLSPEQVLGSDVGPPSDVYALGLVLLECLTGQVAYEGNGVEAALARLRRNPAVPEYLDPGWRELLGAMTARDPANRATAQQVSEWLQDAVAHGRAPHPATHGYRRPVAEDPDDVATDIYLGLGTDALRFAPEGSRTPRSAAASPGATRPRRARLRWWAAGGGVLAAAALVLILVLVTRPATSPARPSSKLPDYPSVSGAAGHHLRQLERSIG